MEYQHIVDQLGLLPHPEGGYYKETYRSENIINVLEGFVGERCYCTSIYFLLTAENFSGFHKIKQDEIWHFYEGAPLTIHMISPDGKYSKQRIGMDWENGLLPQFTVPAGYWFASEVKEDFALVGCTVAPGFDFKDFELAKKQELSQRFPEHKEIIAKLTRD